MQSNIQVMVLSSGRVWSWCFVSH